MLDKLNLNGKKKKVNSNDKENKANQELESKKVKYKKKTEKMKTNEVKSYRVKTSKEDAYDVEINKALDIIEDALGLFEEDEDGNRIADLIIEDTLKFTNERLSILSDVNRKDVIGRAIVGVTLLTSLEAYLRYYRVIKISLTDYRTPKETCMVLESLICEGSLSKIEKKKRIKMLCVGLRIEEGYSPNATKLVAYRIMRCLAFLALYGDYVSASALSNFILFQEKERQVIGKLGARKAN